MVGSYGEGQTVGGRIYLPNEPDILVLLQSCFEPLVQVEADEMMIRTVNPDTNPSDFVAPPSQSSRMFWLLDQI